ncbi:MAG: C69 family dipeptidase, partial [Clostridia bacterium]|nr:C69 family dipeptidase [Clostridia bacterium]
GTPYNPYSRADSPDKGKYRTIGINRTGVMSICQIRGDKPDALKALEWICFGSTSFDTILPVYPHVDHIPAYLSEVSTDVSTENFYWCSRLLGALTDPNYGTAIPYIERYQESVAAKARRIVNEYDRRIIETGDTSLFAEANDKLCEMAKRETQSTLNAVVADASRNMKNGYNRGDH